MKLERRKSVYDKIERVSGAKPDAMPHAGACIPRASAKGPFRSERASPLLRKQNRATATELVSLQGFRKKDFRITLSAKRRRNDESTGGKGLRKRKGKRK